MTPGTVAVSSMEMPLASAVAFSVTAWPSRLVPRTVVAAVWTSEIRPSTCAVVGVEVDLLDAGQLAGLDRVGQLDPVGEVGPLDAVEPLTDHQDGGGGRVGPGAGVAAGAPCGWPRTAGTRAAGR